MGRVREKLGRWISGGTEPAPPKNPLLFADHEEIQDIARQMSRTKVELDRSILTLRSWARDLSRRVTEGGGRLDQGHDLRSLGETVGGLAHNFNNSLAAILAYTELLLRDAQKDSQAHRRLLVVRDVALEASATVRRLQDFVSRQPEVAFGPVGLPAVIQEALDLTAPRWRDDAQRRGVAITVAQDMEALPPVEGIAFELRDALVRLILNAVQAMPDGGNLGIRAASEESGWVVIEVRDTGIGMTEEHSRLLTHRALQGTPTARGGRGLAEVAEIVERHGGSLSIESEPGRGTVVRMRLHASRFQIIPPSVGMVEPVHPEQAARILLVDDDPRLLVVLSDTLQACGHAVTTASKGEEALELFDASKHDVVITDLGMPRMNGWEVAERVKAVSPDTPVFLLTGWGEGVAAHEGSQFVDRVVAKPVSAASTASMMRMWARTFSSATLVALRLRQSREYSMATRFSTSTKSSSAAFFDIEASAACMARGSVGSGRLPGAGRTGSGSRRRRRRKARSRRSRRGPRRGHRPVPRQPAPSYYNRQGQVSRRARMRPAFRPSRPQTPSSGSGVRPSIRSRQLHSTVRARRFLRRRASSCSPLS